MNHRFRFTSLALLVAFAACFLPVLGVLAQFDPGEHTIHQDGRLVGVILVPDREVTDCVYEERWFLFDEYVYPSTRSPVVTSVVPVETLPEEALVAIDEGAGHWVTVLAREHTESCS